MARAGRERAVDSKKRHRGVTVECLHYASMIVDRRDPVLCTYATSCYRRGCMQCKREARDTGNGTHLQWTATAVRVSGIAIESSWPALQTSGRGMLPDVDAGYRRAGDFNS